MVEYGPAEPSRRHTTAHAAALVHDEDSLARCGHLPCRGQPRNPGTYDESINMNSHLNNRLS